VTLATTVRCTTPDCPYVETERTVHAQHLGQGVYLVGDLVCACGIRPYIVRSLAAPPDRTIITSLLNST
jgi:hypothetical protein